MFRGLTGRNFLFLVLLGSCLSLVSCDDDESEEEAPPESDAEAVPEAKEVEEEVVEEIPEGGLSKQECENPQNSTKEKCCRNFDLDDALIKCYILHQKKMPKKGEQNPNLLIKFFSCLLECVYKSKKYIAKGDSLNMKMIHSDANKLYKGDEKQKQYMIGMYEHCERHAAIEWGTYKKNPAARVVFSGACKPYYMFIFLCVTNYYKISCPYYKWKGNKENVHECEDLRNKCASL